MSGWLMWHAESEALFREHDPDKMDSHFCQGCVDVTGDTEMERRFDRKVSEKRRKETLARHKVYAEMVDHQIFPSCVNCLWFGNDEICAIYKVRPPAKTIVLSCVESWQDDIPF